MYFTAFCEKCDITGQMKDIRLPIVDVLDSCSRVNGVLCTVARSWLLFHHDESECKNFESNIA